MASVIWPPSLPQTQFMPLILRRQPNVIATQMDVGPAKYRKRSTKVRIHTDITMELNGAQLETFWTFWDNISDGALPFDWERPDTDATVEMRFRNGQPPEFQLEIGAAKDDRLWTGTLELEVSLDAS